MSYYVIKDILSTKLKLCEKKYSKHVAAILDFKMAAIYISFSDL